MGIYDRDYYQGEHGGYGGGFAAPGTAGSMSITVRLILLNSIIFIVGLFLQNKDLPADWLGVSDQTLLQPWKWFQFLTYGFIHSPRSGEHLIFNMIGLWFFGRPLENRLGRREFLTLYLTTIVVGGIVTSLRAYLMGTPTQVIGASGAISGVILLFIFYYPRVQVLFMFFLPMPAWVLGILLVGFNLMGVMSPNSHTAFDVHLAGFAMAALYHYGHWNLTSTFQRLLPIGGRNPLKRRPKLRVLHPEKKDDKLAREADRILEKLHREGIDSLTAKERKTLERYSRRVRDS